VGQMERGGEDFARCFLHGVNQAEAGPSRLAMRTSTCTPARPARDSCALVALPEPSQS
jgi:hypothetical protein